MLLEDRLRPYFDHPEHKAFPPDGIGILERRNVIVTAVRHIGRETVSEDELAEFADPDLELAVHREPLILEGQARQIRRRTKTDLLLLERLRHAPLRALARMTGISCNALSSYRRGATAPDPNPVARILAALNELDRVALAEKDQERRAAHLRERIKSLDPGATEISGVTRLMRALEPQIDRGSFKTFIYVGRRSQRRTST